jgi:hypothetical protein
MRTTKSDNAGEAPSALAGALAGAEAVLTRFDVYGAAMIETGRAISESLASERELRAQLGAAEIAGGADVAGLRQRLAHAVDEREGAARRRVAAANGLLTLERELTDARAAVDQERAELSEGLIREFTARWNAACAQLAQLRGEAEALGRALRTTVVCAAPYTTRSNPISGMPELRAIAPPAPPQAVALPPSLQSLSGTLDRLESGAALLTAVQQARQQNERHRILCRGRGAPETCAGVYEVAKPVSFWGVTFQRGALLDNSVMTDAALHRFLTARFIRPVNVGASAAA